MRHIFRFVCMSAISATLGCSCSSSQGGKLAYPAAPTDSTVTDNYFGTIVADPYRPLENDTAPITLEWVKAENDVTESYLAKIPYRDKIRKRLTALNNFRKTGLPSLHKDGKYYFFENDGLQNQSVLYRTDKLGGDREVFLDPNTLSDDGTVALTGISFSNDGRYAAYTISRNGSDWTEIYVLDAKTGKPLNDHIEWAKFTGADWEGDGFYYSAYPRPEKGKEFSNANENHQIYYHKIGTPQSEDRLVYEDKAHPLHFHSAYVPESEDYLFVIGAGEGVGNSVMLRPLKDNGNWVIMEHSQDYNINIVDVIDGKIYFITNYGAPRNRLMVADVKAPQRANWRELVPQGEGVMTGVEMAGPENMIVEFEKDAASHDYLYKRDGSLIREIEFPTFGSVGVSADKDHNEVYYALASFTSPSTIYSYDMGTGESKLVSRPELEGVNLDDYVTEQVFYPSADGTKIPMFLTYKKGLKKDGTNPVYLYGYGGFNVSLTPSFSPNRLLWLENGGIYAQANLRGGSEYGEDWHLAGTKMNKLNVFNDFIAAGEYLVKEGWTSPEKMAIVGGSNGGLLVGATVNMRPDLFKVAIPEVGVMDMMRYHLFTIGWNWASDYGTSADSKEMADYLLAYSPIHNIKNDGTPYPAILITTADHDDRVVPAHSFKYAATLQAADTGDAPKLIRIDSKAGHGGGKPMSKVIDEYADIYSFIFNNIGMTPTSK
ncbi:MAG: prolyl oligopeptidase family serine peptidase [Muribaculaceae bacterium]|nr:prolyl oligopeptidase family serine peptidase [Muribaculaceae bacterium]